MEKIQLKSGELIEGSLEGNIVIEDSEYKLLIGFANKNNKVSLSMNIYNESDSSVMIFGKPVISENDMKEIEEKRLKVTEKKKSNISEFNLINNEETVNLMSTTRTFDYVKSETAYMDSSKIDDVYGVRVKLYQEENNGELLLLKGRSYAEDIEVALNNYDGFSEAVELYEVRAGFYFEEGHSTGTHPAEDDDGSDVFVYRILYDVLSLFGIPTSTLDAALNDGKGSLNVVDSVLQPSIEIQAGTDLEMDYDDKDVEIFIVGLNAHQGKVEGDFYAEMQYKERYHVPLGGYVYNYYESERAQDYFNLTVVD
ncbi:hypothetical protein [Thermohalobacter berrensis]|uniref:Uncharacterized protein n=1 Tax=Thermohalobacter berrensis TaxID=99594 RepID=A0A419T109_9FIRM|nr:hypothetical protein [Thermohalobacter berrensis]RKD31260.1 hypothetical protein BET03_03790 [Thermohalobacter berrensis]